ncbi:MAG: carbohydrate kinase [Pseudomonadota bacterium]
MFVVCGEALWDLFVAEGDGGLVMDARIGGSPFNVAVGLARLGQPSALFTGLSRDSLGQRLEAALHSEGVATEFLLRNDRPTTLALVDWGPDGRPVYAFYGDQSADRAVTASDLPALSKAVWGLHAGSYSLVVEPVGAALLALFEAQAGQRLLTLDPNVRPTVEPDIGLWRDRVERFVALADLVKVSDEDIDLLYPGRAIDEIAGRWRELGAGSVIVTRGGDGAEAFSAAGKAAVPGRQVALVDTVGAGDTFHAALIVGLAERGYVTGRAVRALDTAALTSLLDFAVAAASVTCTRRGADLPRRDELPSQAP